MLGHVALAETSSEITAIPKVWALCEVCGATIPIDAMRCQTEIANKIREKKGNYILAIQDKQKTLHQDIREYCEGLERGAIRQLAHDGWKTEAARTHRRVEQRDVQSGTDIGWLAGTGA